MSIRGFDRLVESEFFPHKGGGGGGGTSTQTVISVPEWARPAVAAFAQEAYNMWQAPTLSAYSGATTASMDSNEVAGINGLATRGIIGDPVVQAGTTFVDDAINGDYLDGTLVPFTDMLAKIATMTAGSFASIIPGKTPFVNGPLAPATTMAEDLLASEDVYNKYLGRNTKALYADNRKRERANQDQALSYGVEMGKHPAVDAETLRKAGLYMREFVQYGYEMDHKLFLEQQNLAVSNLEIMGNVIRGLTGSQKTSTGTYAGQSKSMSVIGYGVAGAMIGASVGGPVGAAVGFAVGAVAGLIWG